MKSVAAAVSLALASFMLGCKSWTESGNTILVGGERVMFYRAGTAVPAVPAEANTNGWYSLTAHELDAILNP